MSDHDDAARYAAAAGELLLDLARRPTTTTGPAGRWATRATCSPNRHLLELLHDEHPDDRILSEESADDPRRLDADRVWIVDPLDGTREFTETGRRRLGRPRRALGATAQAQRRRRSRCPRSAVVLSTGDAARGAAADGRRPRIVVSRSRGTGRGAPAAEALDGDLVYLGSAGAKPSRSCSARSTRMCMRAGSTSGTPPRRRGRRRRPVSTRRGSTARRCEYNRPDRGSPTSSCAGPSSRLTSWRPRAPY